MSRSETAAVLAQIDALLSRAGLQPGAQLYIDSLKRRDKGERTSLTTAWVAGLERLAPRGSEYREAARMTIENWGHGRYEALLELSGILNALRNDFEAGYLATLEQLIHADLFADFLEMGQHLLDSGYKDPAAVIAGSVLEEHLRKLSVKEGIQIEDAKGRPRTADTLNADLAKAGAYNKLQQKAVTAWLGLRNDAAHGHYDQYDERQVAALIRDVRDFLLRYPA